MVGRFMADGPVCDAYSGQCITSEVGTATTKPTELPQTGVDGGDVVALGFLVLFTGAFLLALAKRRKV